MTGLLGVLGGAGVRGRGVARVGMRGWDGLPACGCGGCGDGLASGLGRAARMRFRVVAACEGLGCSVEALGGGQRG